MTDHGGKMVKEVIQPSASRLVEGLRDTGYEFNTALADIIDNSIAANANKVHVTIDMDYSGDVIVSVADNGCGMNREDLVDAMRYGSRRRDDPASLGKFGMGLKTASTAFCRRLSVVSRGPDSSEAVKATWDLDHIAECDSWELLIEPPSEEQVACLDEVAGEGPGTLVLWEKVDRIFKTDYKYPGGGAAQNAFKKLRENFVDHTAMVYQRFLDHTDGRAPNVDLFVNGVAIQPWDPFTAIGADAEVVAEERMEAETPDGKKAPFEVRAVVMPRTAELTRENVKKARLGASTQGLYIYRQNRLIHSGDWLGMFQREPHLTLLRVDFSFDHRLDDAFHVDIKKSRILLDEDLAEWLRKDFLNAPRRAADQRYRKGLRSDVTKAGKEAHRASNITIGRHAEEVKEATLSNPDAASNTADLSNPQGKFKIKIPVTEARTPGECYVQTAESIDDGLLWEPLIIEGHPAVRINTGHPYYRKVYLPNITSGVAVQGMDSLLWALCEAEHATWSESVKTHFTELRFKVSSILRHLVAELPEPELDEKPMDDADE